MSEPFSANQLNWGFDIAVIFASVSTACTLFAIVFTILFRDRASFVFAQPSFLLVLLVGVLILQLSQFFLAQSLRDALVYSGGSVSCTIYLWLFWIGCSLALSAQCARLYRALLVFRERSLRRPNMNTVKFFASLGALFMIPMIFMIIRMVTSPVQITQGVCLPLEVAANANIVVVGLFVRLSVWMLLGICFWFTRILEKFGATVDDARIQSKVFFWVLFSDAVISGFQADGMPTDHVAILMSGNIAFSTIVGIYGVYRIKITRMGLSSKELLAALRRERQYKEIDALALKNNPMCRWPSRNNCCRVKKVEEILGVANPQVEIPPSSRAPRLSMQDTFDGPEDVFISDMILASMPVSHPSLRISNPHMNPGNAHSSLSYGVMNALEPMVPQTIIPMRSNQYTSSM